MDPADIKKMATLMPNADSFICQRGSHLCMWVRPMPLTEGDRLVGCP
jgi:hypothetical protein